MAILTKLDYRVLLNQEHWEILNEVAVESDTTIQDLVALILEEWLDSLTEEEDEA